MNIPPAVNITAALAHGLELVERNRQAEVSAAIIQRLVALQLVDGVGGRYRPTKIGTHALSEHFDMLAALDFMPPCQFWRA